MVTVRRTDATKETLMDTNAGAWGVAESTKLDLQPTPVAMQPSEYIQSTVNQADVGAIKQLEVRALHNGQTLFFQLRWDDAEADESVVEPSDFSDGAAIMFPFKDDAPLIVMGTEDQPVNQWHWKADEPQPFNVTTAGLGTTYRTPESLVEAASAWQNGAWRVVLARDLETADPDNHVTFQANGTLKAAFCVWEGAAKERAGLKAFSPTWIEFDLEA
jgi:DMSO reductase family type II enzyme heme b subunit